MKLPQLLSHFLYQNKTLSLQGIGIFTLDPSTVIPEETEKESPQVVQGVEFDNTTVLKPDPALIEFIHKYTGKMKPLAESDLDSYLRLGIQLLNIGKPFYLEGIGSILKNNEGKYEFVPGEFINVKLSMPGEEKAEMAEKRKKVLDVPEKEYAPQSKAAKKILLTIGVVGGIVLIAWAGFNLYKKKTVPAGSNSNENSAVVLKDDTVTEIRNDTVAAAPPDSNLLKKKDSVTIVSKKASDSSFYKFVILTTTNKNRALRRYKQLDSIEHNVKLNTKDSSIFKVYFVIRAFPKDTLHIKDSLNSFYATKTIIEH